MNFTTVLLENVVHLAYLKFRGMHKQEISSIPLHLLLDCFKLCCDSGQFSKEMEECCYRAILLFSADKTDFFVKAAKLHSYVQQVSSRFIQQVTPQDSTIWRHHIENPRLRQSDTTFKTTADMSGYNIDDDREEALWLSQDLNNDSRSCQINTSEVNNNKSNINISQSIDGRNKELDLYDNLLVDELLQETPSSPLHISNNNTTYSNHTSNNNIHLSHEMDSEYYYNENTNTIMRSLSAPIAWQSPSTSISISHTQPLPTQIQHDTNSIKNQIFQKKTSPSLIAKLLFLTQKWLLQRHSMHNNNEQRFVSLILYSHLCNYHINPLITSPNRENTIDAEVEVEESFCLHTSLQSLLVVHVHKDVFRTWALFAGVDVVARRYGDRKLLRRAVRTLYRYCTSRRRRQGRRALKYLKTNVSDSVTTNSSSSNERFISNENTATASSRNSNNNSNDYTSLSSIQFRKTANSSVMAGAMSMTTSMTMTMPSSQSRSRSHSRSEPTMNAASSNGEQQQRQRSLGGGRSRGSNKNISSDFDAENNINTTPMGKLPNQSDRYHHSDSRFISPLSPDRNSISYTNAISDTTRNNTFQSNRNSKQQSIEYLRSSHPISPSATNANGNGNSDVNNSMRRNHTGSYFTAHNQTVRRSRSRSRSRSPLDLVEGNRRMKRMRMRGVLHRFTRILKLRRLKQLQTLVSSAFRRHFLLSAVITRQWPYTVWKRCKCRHSFLMARLAFLRSRFRQFRKEMSHLKIYNELLYKRRVDSYREHRMCRKAMYRMLFPAAGDFLELLKIIYTANTPTSERYECASQQYMTWRKRRCMLSFRKHVIRRRMIKQKLIIQSRRYRQQQSRQFFTAMTIILRKKHSSHVIIYPNERHKRSVMIHALRRWRARSCRTVVMFATRLEAMLSNYSKYHLRLHSVQRKQAKRFHRMTSCQLYKEASPVGLQLQPSLHRQYVISRTANEHGVTIHGVAIASNRLELVPLPLTLEDNPRHLTMVNPSHRHRQGIELPSTAQIRNSNGNIVVIATVPALYRALDTWRRHSQRHSARSKQDTDRAHRVSILHKRYLWREWRLMYRAVSSSRRKPCALAFTSMLKYTRMRKGFRSKLLLTRMNQVQRGFQIFFSNVSNIRNRRLCVLGKLMVTGDTKEVRSDMSSTTLSVLPKWRRTVLKRLIHRWKRHSESILHGSATIKRKYVLSASLYSRNKLSAAFVRWHRRSHLHNAYRRVVLRKLGIVSMQWRFGMVLHRHKYRILRYHFGVLQGRKMNVMILRITNRTIIRILRRTWQHMISLVIEQKRIVSLLEHTVTIRTISSVMSHWTSLLITSRTYVMSSKRRAVQSFRKFLKAKRVIALPSSMLFFSRRFQRRMCQISAQKKKLRDFSKLYNTKLTTVLFSRFKQLALYSPMSSITSRSRSIRRNGLGFLLDGEDSIESHSMSKWNIQMNLTKLSTSHHSTVLIKQGFHNFMTAVYRTRSTCRNVVRHQFHARNVLLRRAFGVMFSHTKFRIYIRYRTQNHIISRALMRFMTYSNRKRSGREIVAIALKFNQIRKTIIALRIWHKRVKYTTASRARLQNACYKHRIRSTSFAMVKIKSLILPH